MIPILFKEDETNFNSNGIGHLKETITYDVREVRNGEFELYLEYPVTGIWFTEIKDFRLILAEPNEVDDDHLFRIYELVKSADSQTIFVYATTKSNDLGGNLVNDVKIVNNTAQEAFNKMKSAMVMASDYNFISDIQTRSSTEWLRRNPLNCIAGEEGSLVNYWGGEIKRTNDTIYLYGRRGKDKVATIRLGKNLQGFTLTSSTKGLITRILPFFTYTPEGKDVPVTINGTIVDSPLVNNYPVKYITPVDFTQDETIKTLAQLNTAAAKYFTTMNPGCDKPSVSVDIDLMQLSDSSEYEKFKALERIQLTDTVTVWVKKYNVDVDVKVTEITYNGMQQMVTNIVAGTSVTNLYDDVKKTYKDDISDLQKYVKGMENGIRNTIQISADGKNTIFRGYTQPDISISKLNDTWFKEIGNGEVEIWTFDGAYWQPIITAGLNAAVRAEVEKMIQQADDDRELALVNFDKAVTDAETYTNTKSAEFDAKLLVVNTTLDATKATANNSLIRADKAILDAGFAQVDASKAISDSGIALSTANTAKTNAGTALTNASAALTRVGAVEVTTGQLTTNYNTLTQTLTTKADKTIVDGIKGTVDSHSVDIETNATAITLKANTTTVNTLTGLVNTHTTQIKATSDGLALKADSTTVSTLTGTVTTHTGQISANSTAIGLRLTSAQVESAITAKNYVNTTTLNATANGLTAQITQVNNDLEAKVVTIEANINGINTLVASKADKSQITQLSTLIQSKVESSTYSTKMTQLDSAINLRVVQGDVTAAILADKKVKDTRATNQLPSWYYSNFPAQISEEFKQRTAIGSPGTATYGLLTTKVPYADVSGGSITQIFSSGDGVYQRVSTSAAAWGAWDKVSEAGQLISQINISTEGILLQGKRIQLDGEVAMNSAFITRLDTQTLTAVTANIASIRTQILVADVITSTHLKSDVALINKIFATDANVTTLTAKTAFVNSIKAVEISATKITSGTLNAALLTVLNINVSSLVGNTSDFVLSKWNAANTSISITASGLISVSGTLSTLLNAGSLTTTSGTKTGVVNANGMEISDSSNGWTTRLYSDGLEFKWYGINRGITQTSEGLDIKPTTGSGARLNSALSLTTGPGNDKIAYIQLSNPDGAANSRLEMNRLQLSLRHPNGGSLDIADYAYNGANGKINSGKFTTTTTDGRGIEMAVSQIKALAGNQTIYIMPTGTGELRIGNGSANPTLWPVRAASFVQGSSRASKSNIVDYRGDALKTLSELKIVTYNRKDELERGIVYESIGVIAEDSNSIRAYEPPNTNTPAGIDNYKMVSLAVKGIQELDRRTHNDVAWLQVRVSSLEIQVIALTKKIEQMESAA